MSSCFGLVACVEDSERAAMTLEQAEVYRVRCTVGMITDIVRNVAGDYAQVEGIIGEGVDPHLYKPTRGDVIALSQADVVFYNGLLLEGKMTDVLVRVASTGKPVKAVTEAILDDTDYLLNREDGSEHTDPHVWMDVGGWMRAVPVVAETLAAFDPEHADEYRANAATYVEQLKALDAYAKTAIASIPEGQRVLVTAHDAFQYLGRAYGIEVRGIQGVSTESEAGVRDLEDLVDFIVERQIPAVFVETSVADKNVRALVEGARARRHDVVIGGSLFSDAMGPAGSYEGSYIGMIDHNVTTITNALGGSAKGFRQ
ncbi:zinc ABC transporter substrate-binding protein [Coraliomargarita sp. SDUM461004]|uniref:Zinc ABC transporter substrate-binding protein n=1 Tax=Thalassobacterium sedimentorum TaxID=3041258 RepID=A0ABU1AF88_9BACT|nr:zinc ABC transporter substrate-binding protein [Coraliomargarita sp. SDUM461004]MDQ8193204.1 zinc ABC transporter substrate-binding protein [Coraliomargarita sp. SDUM461004]